MTTTTYAVQLASVELDTDYDYCDKDDLTNTLLVSHDEVEAELGALVGNYFYVEADDDDVEDYGFDYVLSSGLADVVTDHTGLLVADLEVGDYNVAPERN